jgi:DNA-binding HxlR family transcriptional regulator
MSPSVDPHSRAYRRASDLIAHPWAALLLALLEEAPLRFSELERRASGVGSKSLALRLKELKNAGVVERVVEAGPPLRVCYGLTPKGRAFGRVAMSIERWGRTLIADEPRSRRAKKLR